jgi:hypothetical protein
MESVIRTEHDHAWEAEALGPYGCYQKQVNILRGSTLIFGLCSIPTRQDAMSKNAGFR